MEEIGNINSLLLYLSITNNENTFDFQWPLQPNYSGEKNWILIYLPLKALPSKHFELLIKNNSGITILNWKLIAYKNKFAVRPDFSPSNNRLAWNLNQSTNWYQNGPEHKGQLISKSTTTFSRFSALVFKKIKRIRKLYTTNQGLFKVIKFFLFDLFLEAKAEILPKNQQIFLVHIIEDTKISFRN